MTDVLVAENDDVTGVPHEDSEALSPHAGALTLCDPALGSLPSASWVGDPVRGVELSSFYK